MSKFTLKSDSQSEQEILLPVNSLYPPNEIISKKYAPDAKANFKLIPPQKKQKKRMTLPTEQPPPYLEYFQQKDTLGFEYSSLLRNKLVYLKYQNTSYMKLSLNGKTIKYLGGMFIPLDKLLSDSLKKAKNIFKILPNFQYTDNKYPVDSSFGGNCYSNAPNPRFSSNYQSSNLFAAIKVGDGEFDLILQNDTNSRGNTQWFNFTVQMNEQKNYKFNIVNLTKSSSLYQKGMNVAYYSQMGKLNNKIGWTKGCHNISYAPTSVSREDNYDHSYHCLHFQYKSNYKNDVVTFAYSFPYNLIDLERFFNKVLIKRPIGTLKVQKVKVAETLTGFSVNAYAFTQKRHSQKKNLFSTQTMLESREQGLPSVIFLARQHPGQSQGSYVAEGIVEWLTETDYDYWKKSFHFYVIPMINMDGVYYGNYRTNLSGNDLNRIWRHPRRDYHCQIHSLKKFLYGLNKTNPIALIVDIHGHSNSLNSFFYGNPQKKDGQNPKLFPYYCSRKIKPISYHQSTFSVSSDKKACARVVLSQMFPKALVYTFQNSFYGWKRGKSIIEHTIESYRRLGRDLVQCFLQYARLSEKNPSIKERWTKEIEELVKDCGDNQEEVVSESDEDIANQLVEFQEMNRMVDDSTASPDYYLKRNNDKKKTMPAISKNQFLKYVRRHSPLKLRNYCTSNQTYIMEKPQQTSRQPQGFLSIVKINTKSQLDSSQLDINRRTVSINKDSLEVKDDFVVEDQTEIKESQKENNNRKNKKLITQKELIMQKMRQNRRRLEEGMIHSKTTNGFFRYNYIRKS